MVIGVAGRHVGLIHIIENAQLARVLVVQGEVVVVGAGLDAREVEHQLPLISQRNHTIRFPLGQPFLGKGTRSPGQGHIRGNHLRASVDVHVAGDQRDALGFRPVGLEVRVAGLEDAVPVHAGGQVAPLLHGKVQRIARGEVDNAFDLAVHRHIGVFSHIYPKHRMTVHVDTVQHLHRKPVRDVPGGCHGDRLRDLVENQQFIVILVDDGQAPGED